jgi:hypothetical protein
MQKLRPLLIPDGENTYWLKAYSRALPEPTLEHRLAKTHKLLSKKYLKQRTFHPLLCQAVVCEKLCRLRAVFLCCPRASNLLSSHYAFSRFGSSQERENLRRLGDFRYFSRPCLLRASGRLDTSLEPAVDPSFSKGVFKIGYFCQSR